LLNTREALGGLVLMAKETYIVKSKVADFIRGKKMMMSADAYEALNGEVEGMMKRAIERCSQGGRKTVKPFDF
jgi:histone H3/H4